RGSVRGCRDPGLDKRAGAPDAPERQGARGRMAVMTSTVGASPGAREPLRHREFRWLLAARVTGFVGGAVAPVALAFAVLDLTGSVRDLGLVVGARSLANVLLLLVGGVLADRLPLAVLL